MNYNSPALLHPSKVSAFFNEAVVPTATSPEVPFETNYEMPLFNLAEEEQADYDKKKNKGSLTLPGGEDLDSDGEGSAGTFPLLLELAKFRELFLRLILTSDPNTFYLHREIRPARGIDADNPISSHLKILIDMREIRPRSYSRWTSTLLQVPPSQLINSV